MKLKKREREGNAHQTRKDPKKLKINRQNKMKRRIEDKEDNKMLKIKEERK